MPPTMPSLCRIYRNFGNPVLVAADVPCRLVPVTWGGRAREVTIAEVAFSHWIDLPPSTIIQGGLQRSGQSTTRYAFNDSMAYLVVVEGQYPFDRFMIVTVERRWVDTIEEHIRAYAQMINTNEFP